MFISAGLLFAGYTVAMRKAGLDGLHAAAIAAVGSLIAYVPVYAIVSGDHLFNVPGLILFFKHLCMDPVRRNFAYALRTRHQPSWCINGSAFAALAPAITAILAVPLLGEWPATTDWIAMLLISGGVYIASGGLLPVRADRTTWTFNFGGRRAVGALAVTIARIRLARENDTVLLSVVYVRLPGASRSYAGLERLADAGVLGEAVHLGCIGGGTCRVAVDEHDSPVGLLGAEAVAEARASHSRDVGE